MPSDNKHNLLYFEATTMRGLYQIMEEWQAANRRRLLSVSIQLDGSLFCCIALTNPMEVVVTEKAEVVIVDKQELNWAHVTADGLLKVGPKID